MRTLLFLTPRFPWPLIGGDRIKCYHLLRHLGSTHRVILVTFSHGKAAPPDHLEAIRALGVEVHSIRLNPLLAAIGCLRTFFTRKPIEIAFYHRPAFTRKVNEILASTQIDIGIAFFMRTAEYIRRHTSFRKILIAEDSRIEYQTRSMRASTSLLQRLVRWWEIQKLRMYEPGVIHDFDVVTYVTQQDVDAMNAVLPSDKYAIVTNGVNGERFWYQADQERRRGVLFIGKLDVHANELMVDTILDDIMPLVRKRMQPSDAHVTIVGMRRGSKPRSDEPGVVFTGLVPDGVPYLHDAAVFLHPHSGASGIQNKLLEAMSAGCAVVTTRTGLQGIDAEHGKHCLVFTTTEEAADHVVRLLEHPELRKELAANARALMDATHSWQHVDEQLDAVLEAHPPAHTERTLFANARASRTLTALLLDRDGIVNERIVDAYVRNPEEFRLMPGIVPIIRLAQQHAIPVILITNQQGVGKGLMSADDLDVVHRHMNDVVKSQTGAPLDAIYVCTSLAEANDIRRKPNPGMILEAIADHHLTPQETWFLGDSLSDAEAGKRAGVRTMLVGPFPPHAADIVVQDLTMALEQLTILIKN